MIEEIIKLNCDVLDPDKLIVVSVANPHLIPDLNEKLMRAFPSIMFLIVDYSLKVEEIDTFIKRKETSPKRGKPDFYQILWSQTRDLKDSEQLRRTLDEKLRNKGPHPNEIILDESVVKKKELQETYYQCQCGETFPDSEGYKEHALKKIDENKRGHETWVRLFKERKLNAS